MAKITLVRHFARRAAAGHETEHDGHGHGSKTVEVLMHENTPPRELSTRLIPLRVSTLRGETNVMTVLLPPRTRRNQVGSRGTAFFPANEETRTDNRH